MVTRRAKAWNEIESAHAAVGGTGPGRRYATQQINQAYAVSISAQFQRFCRALHSEAADALAAAVSPRNLHDILQSRMLEGRKLDVGNPNPGNLGSDFGRLGFDFWQAVINLDTKNASRKNQLEQLNAWRNAIAHQDFNPAKLGGIMLLRLINVRRWRSMCGSLSLSFDEVTRQRLASILGTSPW
jgi:hypothetical protein